MLHSLVEILKTKIAAYLVLFSGIAITLTSFWYVHETIKEKEQLRLEIAAKQSTILIQERMNGYREILYAGAGLFNSSEKVERNEWHEFVNTLKLYQNFPGIQGLGYSEVVRPQQKAKHIARIREEGYSDYTIRPEGDRELYTSIVYIEPFDARNRRAFGYDMFSEEVRREAMTKAALSGEAATSGKVHLVQDSTAQKQAGFLVYVPVYHKGMPLKTEKQRFAAIKGFVYAPFRVNDLMYGVLGQRYKYVALKIHDGMRANKSNLIFSGETEKGVNGTISVENRIDINGRIWTFRFKPLQEFLSEGNTTAPWYVLSLGTLLSFSLFGIMVMVVRTKERAQELAEKMTQELSEQKERLNWIIEGTNVGTWEWNIQSGETIFNERWANIIGYTLEEISPVSIETWMRFSHPEDLKESGRLLERHFSGEIDYYAFESRMKHKEGHWVWVLDRGKVSTWSEDGKPLWMSGTHQDITDSKRVDEALKKANEKMQLAANSAGLGIWNWDIETNMLEWDDWMFKLYGVKSEDFSGAYEAWEKGLHPEDRAKAEAELQMGIRGEKEFNTVFRILRSNGEVRYLKATAQVVRDENGKPLRMVGINYDITEQVRITRELEEANIAKSQFLSNMSHEIRTPMNAIIGLSELMYDTKLDDLQYDYLNKIHGSSKMLLGIINDILDYSKIEANKVELECNNVDLENVLEQLRVIFTQSAVKQGIELYFHLKNDVPGIIIGDELRLNQVLSNLLSNALKFTQKGNVTLNIALKERLNDDRATISFSISDTGIGMSDEEIAKLFHPFVQADSSITRKYGGTGLGLAISKRLVNAMGGDLSVLSQKDSGTTFSFDIEAQVASWEQNHPKIENVRCRILIVDDQAISRIILKEMIESFQCSADEAISGEEAISMVVQADKDGNGYDFILMDWNMPGMNGKDTIKEMNKMSEEGTLTTKIPSILMVSAYAKDQIDLNDVSIDCFLAKPVTCLTLFEAMISAKNGILRHIKMDKRHDIPDMSGLNVLLVEDNELNQEVATIMLRKVGIKVETAQNGKEAVELFLSKPDTFDLILMDLQMPIMSGYEATAIIREHDKEIPIIALTAAAMVEDKDKALFSGMNDHLGKPIDMASLYAAIAKWCNISQSEHALLPESDNKSEKCVLDIEYALKIVSGNKELLSKLLLQLLAQLEGEFVNVQVFVERNDPAAAPLIHALKGVSGNLGAKVLSALCSRIDAAYKGGESVSAEDADRLGREIEALKAEITIYINNNNAGTSNMLELSRSEFKNFFDDVKYNVQQHNIISPERIRTLSDALKNRVNESELNGWNEAMDRFQFQRALDIMEKWGV